MPIQVVCPACQRKLQIPDAHAGKKVKCPCGSAISVPTAAPQTPPTQRPGNPAVPPPSPASFDLGAGDLFDELTESDFQAGPAVGSIRINRGPTVDRQAEAATLQKYSGEEPTTKGRKPGRPAPAGYAADHQGPPADRPIGVLLISIWNFIVTAGLLFLALLALGLVGALATQEQNAETEAATTLVAGAGVIMLVSAGLTLAVAISLLVRSPAAWCFALFGYGYSIGDRVGSGITQAMVAEDTVKMAGNIAGASVGLVISSAILAYLFTGGVRRYFMSDQMPVAGPVAAIIGGITIGGGVVAIASLLLGG